MNTALELACVTYLLQDLLRTGVTGPQGPGLSDPVPVTALPPDRLAFTPPAAPSRLNLFLYWAEPTASLRNQGLPTRDVQGQRVAAPALALELHYVLTAYGAEDLHAELLLGYGIQRLYDHPVLTGDSLRQALAGAPSGAAGALPPVLRHVATSEWAQQLSSLSIRAETLPAEAMTRLWTAFQAPYRLSAFYKVTLLGSQRPTLAGLPVRPVQPR